MVTTNYLTNLESLAGKMGVRIRTAPTPANWWGVYDRRHKLITLRPKLARYQYDSTLAHELGHAINGHHGHNPKTEQMADRWAAKFLLDLDQVLDYAAVNADTNSLAASLGVMPWVLEAFRETLTPAQRAIVGERLREQFVA